MGFVLKKRLDLAGYGDDWKECYIELREPTIDEVQAIGQVNDKNAVKEITKILEKCFVSGRAYDGSKVVDMVASDLSQLPTSIFQDLTTFFTPKPKEQ